MTEQNQSNKVKKGAIGGGTLAVIIIIGIIFLAVSMTKIPAGYVGVVYNVNGGIEDDTLSQGWHFVGPGKKVTKYSIGIEQSYLTAGNDGDSKDDDSFSAPSSDGKGLTMELTFTYRYDEKRVADVFKTQKGRSGEEVLTTFIKPNIISWTKEVTAKYPVTEILGEKRAELNTVLSEYLASKFTPYGIIIENASLINIEVDEQTRASITKKVTAQQELELANIEAQTAKVNADKEKEVAIINAEKEKEAALIEAQKNKETAQLNAETAKIKAEGEAQALKIKAQAEADANTVISESLTSELLEKIKYENWDGQLPQVTGSNTPIIDVK